MAHAVPPPRAGLITRKDLILVAIVAAAAVAAGLAQTSAGHSLLRRAGLYAEPAHYTSLAFIDPQSLPTHLSPAPTRVSVPFAVTNTSAGPRSYHWSIALDRAGHTDRLAAGQVGVPAGDRATVTRTVAASCATGQARMTVQIAAPAESIDFWLACWPPGGGNTAARTAAPAESADSFLACETQRGKR
jgi:hypothetical protein